MQLTCLYLGSLGLEIEELAELGFVLVVQPGQVGVFTEVGSVHAGEVGSRGKTLRCRRRGLLGEDGREDKREKFGADLGEYLCF